MGPIDLSLLSKALQTLDEKFKKEGRWIDAEAKEDLEFFSSRKNDVIAGFLSMGEKDGWKALSEGNHYETGFRFVRYMLRKFWNKMEVPLSEYHDIFENTIKSFSTQVLKNSNGNFPKAMVDATVRGWDTHAIGRIFGNVCTKYQPNGPFFEVLINSTKNNENEAYVYPFSSCILENEQVAKTRRHNLSALANKHGSLAYRIFYPSNLTSPETFIRDYQKQTGKEPGPNALKLLKGLEYAKLVKMKAQVIGNCWIKQPKRCVLICLYLETLSQRPELEPKQAWALAKKLYSKWKKSTLEEIEKLMTQKGICLDLVPLATKKIEHLRKK